MMPTAAAQVPQTPLGKFYLALPDALARVAQAYAAKVGFPAESFRQELMAAASGWTFDVVESFVRQHSAQEVNDYLIRIFPLSIIENPAFDLKLGRIVAQADLLRSGTRAAIAYRQTIQDVGGNVYPTQQLATLAMQVAQNLDKGNLQGDAWNASPGAFSDEEIAKVFPDGVPSNVWRVCFFIAALLYGAGVRKLEDARSVYRLGQTEEAVGIDENGVQYSYSYTIWAHTLWTDCAGEGCTTYNIALDPGGKVVIQSGSEVENWLRTTLIVAAAALAVTGIGAAVASIAAEGVTLANAAGLVSGVGGLPGVDLGVAELVAGGISSGLKLVDTLPGGANVLNFSDIDVDLGVDIPDWDVMPSGIGGDFDLAWDLDLNLAPGALDDVVASIDNFDIAIDPGDVFVDELGNVFDVTGAAVAIDPELYIKSIYVDELGNIYDYSNNVLLGADEAGQIFDELGSDALDQRLAEILYGQSGDTLISNQSPAGRPAGAPQPSGQIQVPTWVGEITSLIKAYFSYDLARDQIKRTGRYNPSYAVSPVGQRTPQLPGVPVRQADGSVVVNNGDGTVTTTRVDGTVVRTPATIDPRSYNPAVPGGAGLIAGMSNTTALLLAGGAVVALALLARRK